MTWADFVILGIIAISALLALFRGFVREALSLASWLLAIWVSLVFARAVAQWLSQYVQADSLRLAIAYVGLFVLTLVAGIIINHMVAKLVKASGFSGTDRMLGILFGVGRGIAVVTLLVLLAGFTALPRGAWWQQSLLVYQFEPLALWVRDRLPARMARQIHYDTQDAHTVLFRNG